MINPNTGRLYGDPRANAIGANTQQADPAQEITATGYAGDTIIDLTTPVVKAAQVYSTVILVEVRSTVALTYVFAISS